MKHFTSVKDVNNPVELAMEAISLKTNPFAFSDLGKNKTLGLVFFNSSLRTRLSTQKAAQNLGMNVMVMNIENDTWTLEFEDGAIMNNRSVEHIKDAAAVLGIYCDVLGIRCFPTLTDRERDYSEFVLTRFIQYCNKPVISLESATLHPLQSLADLITLKENAPKHKPKVVLTWAPHIKPLPQVVANSFAEWMLHSDYDLTITQPRGYELNPLFTRGATLEYQQQKALANADFVYVKNWSSYSPYGQMPVVSENWLLNKKSLEVSHNAKIMHCLPVRRNLELSDELIDSNNSLILKQAENRVFAAQIVLKKILESHT